MAADGKYPTAKVFKDWLPARAVFDRLYPLGFSALANTLADRLRVSLADASGGHLSVREKNAVDGPWLISPAHWKELKAVSENALWRTGQLTVWMRPDERASNVRYDFYDVRFEPGGIARLLEGLESPAKSIEAAPTTAADSKPESPDDRPTVSVTELAQWFALYATIYPNWTAEDAIKSAVGMFSGHKVPRSKVRDLIGPRPRGRPKGA